MLNPAVIQQLRRTTVDDASAMPDLSGRKILMGFWHNWPSNAGPGYQGGRFAEMALTDIPEAYNVVAVAFMKGHGIPTFTPYNMSKEEFRRQVGVLNAQQRAVLISLGGADAHIELYAGQEDALALQIIRLVEDYGFDGLDIDLEQSAIKYADNQTVIPAALKMVREHYAKEGKHFIISMAPEFPYLREGGGYLPYVKALEDYYDFIAPQYYNQGGDGVDVAGIGWLAQDNDARKEDFLYYLTESIVSGTRGFARIPHERFAIGLPSNPDAAATGYVIDAQAAIGALKRLDDAQLPIRGLMTWSVSWDNGVAANGRRYNWEFERRYGFLTGGGGPGERPLPPTGLHSPNQTQNSVSLAWNAASGPQPIVRYTVYRNDERIAEPTSRTFVDTGLQAGTTYRYQVSATDARGETSERSAALPVTTESASGPGDFPSWREETWYDRGDGVTYDDTRYVCIQEHTSNRFWLPPLADMLWLAQPAAR
ncbi:fibronectin type III domain-containing protein [Burkholderia latens]|uniref:fibronectin type III domain-containing protein n=1 Tax=Burkholderia latens TaxID=488446 RepID=UPI001AE49B48|nr:glycosyl hydrolase family 18 protein [Burkholderia latens]QTO46691.1 fibronectin type III domain-containing protein [Burkholderia latens]